MLLRLQDDARAVARLQLLKSEMLTEQLTNDNLIEYHVIHLTIEGILNDRELWWLKKVEKNQSLNLHQHEDDELH